MSLHLQHDWFPVIGEHVEIRINGRGLRSGLVDDVTPDGAILWLAANGADSRMMITRSDGYEVWIDYKWERR
jgi:hypothetical protein